MNLEYFHTIAFQEGWTLSGNFLFGHVSNYPFMAILSTKNVMMRFTFATGHNRETRKVIKDSIAGFPAKLISSGVNNCIAVKITEAEALPAIGRLLVSVFPRLGLYPLDSCPLCKQSGCDCAVLYQNAYVPAHRSCVTAFADRKVQTVRTSIEQGNYVTGLIGTLLGAVVGALPALALLLFADYLVAVLYALIPIGAFYGYNLLGGKRNAVATVTAILVVIPVVFMMMMLYNWRLLLKEGFDFSLGETISLYFSIMSPGDIIAEMLQPLLFAGLGIVVAWRIITNTGKNAYQRNNLMLRTITTAQGYPASTLPTTSFPGTTNPNHFVR